MNFDEFQDILREQKAAGHDGFEGLIAKLLEHLTGQRFFLSLSGRQEGRDMAVNHPGNFLVVECKRYKESSPFKSDELLAKFSAALLGLPPDLWVIVSTKRLGEQHHSQLRLASQRNGVAYLPIDPQGKEASTLMALCVCSPSIVCKHLQESGIDFDEKTQQRLKVYLEHLSQQPHIHTGIEILKNELSVENIGYDDWRREQNEYLGKCLKKVDASEAAFDQDLAVGDKNRTLVHRSAVLDAISGWMSNWPSSHQPLVLLGEEGDGKSWAVAAWLNLRLSEPNPFPLIFLPSILAGASDPKELIIEAIKRQLREPFSGYWEKRLARWLDRPSDNSPMLMLVIDGVNERPNVNWRSLFASLAIEPWSRRVAVLLTCRNTFWQEHLANVNFIALWQISPYDDDELSQALTIKELVLGDFDERMHDLLRVPRYFDMMVRLRSNIDIGGEITRERLIYEDWRDKQSRKLGNSLSHSDFQELISNLSSKIRQNSIVKRRELGSELSAYCGDSQRLFVDLSSGRILERKASGWTVNRDYLILGLGLLLAYEVDEVAEEGEVKVNDVIRAHLEPQADMDLKVSICAMALYHALGEGDLSDLVCLALFKAWISGRNIDRDDWQRITAYIPIRPEIYLQMMEWLWSSQANNMGMQDAFMAGFLRFRYNDRVQQAFIPAFQHWMGFVHSDGHTGRHYRDDAKKLDESRNNVREALGRQPVDGSIDLFGYRLTITADDALLRLSRFALAIISHLPRASYIGAIVTGVLAGTVMGFPDLQKQLSWVLRTASDDVESSLLPLLEDTLMVNPQPIAQKTAWWLLSALATEQAIQLREQIPPKYRYKNTFWQLREENPCQFALILWQRDNYLKCLTTTDFHPNRIAAMLKGVALNPECTVPEWLPQKFQQVGEGISLENIKSSGLGQSSEDHELKEIEAALCAYNPARYAELLKLLTCQLAIRQPDGRKYLAWEVYEHVMIMDEETRSVIDCAWRISLETECDLQTEKYAELVLFPCVLRGRTLEEQLDFIGERGEQHVYFRDYFPFVERVDNNEKSEVVASKLSTLATPAQRYDFLFQIAHSLTYLDESILKLLPDFSELEDSLTRRYALNIIACTGNQQAVQSVLASDWCSEATDNDFERYWGSKLWAENGQRISFSELQSRISVEMLGYAVEQRGSRIEEVSVYGEILHHLWCGIARQNFEIPVEATLVKVKTQLLDETDEFDYSLSTDNDRNITFNSWDSVWGGSPDSEKGEEVDFSEALDHKLQFRKNQDVLKRIQILSDAQKKAGNDLFLRQFRINALAEVVDTCPEYTNQWLQVGLDQTSNIFILCRGFYEALCEVLLEKQPEQGAKLFWRLRQDGNFQLVDYKTNISLLTFYLFKVEESEPVLAARKNLLDKALTDNDLFEIVYLAQLFGKIDWLDNVISRYIDSAFTFEQAKGLYLLGFMDTPSSGEHLDIYLAENQDSWVRDCAKRAKMIYERNQWAHHWFQRFSTHGETLQAWAAFRLFLRSTDRRFWLWGPEIINSTDIQHERFEHYRACRSSILKATKNNENKEFKLHENLVGFKVEERQLWPWMECYQ